MTTRWVQTYDDDTTPPTYADSAEECVRIASELGAIRRALRPVADAEVDDDLSAELARWETLPLLALSVADLTAGIQSLSARDLERLLTAEARGRGRSTALGAIATALRKAEGGK